MARFFFDIDDGVSVTRDIDGLECGDGEQMRRHALDFLPELAGETRPDGDSHMLAVHVRDEGDRYVFRATLSVAAAWLNGRR